MTICLICFFASMFNGDISNWDTSKVKTMSDMFTDASSFTRTFQWNCGFSKSTTSACVCKDAECPPDDKSTTAAPTVSRARLDSSVRNESVLWLVVLMFFMTL